MHARHMQEAPKKSKSHIPQKKKKSKPIIFIDRIDYL